MPKLITNAISFPNPVLKVYEILPRPRKEMESILAIIFVGLCYPAPEELKRVPLLV